MTHRALAFIAIVTLATMAQAGGDIVVDVGRGPVVVQVPDGYDPAEPAPLVVLLHSFTNSGASTGAYLGVQPAAEAQGMLYVAPDGLTNPIGQRYWNATDACCDFFGQNPDDSGYLRDLIDEIRAQLTVNDRRIYAIGHSNGGFMSHRVACDHADLMAAVVTLAGCTWDDPAQCGPSEAVHALVIHGTADSVISYDGGSLLAPYPGAVETVEQWAAHGECVVAGESQPPIDVEASINGAETEVVVYDMGCAPGGSGELWSIIGGSHSPALVASFGELVVAWMLAHPKPSVADPDLDGDGSVGGADLGLLLGAWGPCAGCPADLDGDGDVDGADLGLLLGAWG